MNNNKQPDFDDSDDEFNVCNIFSKEKPVNKENIALRTKSPRKSPATTPENPYKKVYPPKKMRLNELNGSKDKGKEKDKEKDNGDFFQELNSPNRSASASFCEEEEEPNTTVIENKPSETTPKKSPRCVSQSPKASAVKSPKSAEKGNGSFWQIIALPSPLSEH